jgi:hypothetical protein
MGARAPNRARSDAYRSTATSEPQAGLHDGRCGQGRHVKHGARPGHLAHRRPDGRVGQLDHHPDVGSELADQQGGLQGLDLGALRTDDGPGVGQPGLLQDAGDPGAAHDEGDVPGLDDADQAGIGILVHHHHDHAGLVELLDHPQSDTLEAAHDDVTLPVPSTGTIHPRMVPRQHFFRIAAVFRAGAQGAAPPGPA